MCHHTSKKPSPATANHEQYAKCNLEVLLEFWKLHFCRFLWWKYEVFLFVIIWRWPNMKCLQFFIDQETGDRYGVFYLLSANILYQDSLLLSILSTWWRQEKCHLFPHPKHNIFLFYLQKAILFVFVLFTVLILGTFIYLS